MVVEPDPRVENLAYNVRLAGLCRRTRYMAVVRHAGQRIPVRIGHHLFADLLPQPLPRLVGDGLVTLVALVDHAVECLVLAERVLQHGVLYVFQIAIARHAAALVVDQRRGVEHIYAHRLDARKVDAGLAVPLDIAVMGKRLFNFARIFQRKIDCHGLCLLSVQQESG